MEQKERISAVKLLITIVDRGKGKKLPLSLENTAFIFIWFPLERVPLRVKRLIISGLAKRINRSS